MKAGDRVTLTGSEGAYTGVIVLVSPNEASLMVGLDGGFKSRSGMYVNLIPLLRAEDGIYRELLGGEPVQVEVIVTQ